MAEEKAAIVQETYAPGMPVSLVARDFAQGTGLSLAARVQKAAGGEDDRERGRRWTSTG